MKKNNNNENLKTQLIRRKNIHSFCRLCLSEVAQNSSAKGQKFNIHRTQELRNWIATCTPFQVAKGDGYPKFLCQQCFQKLQNLYQFYDMCVKSMQVLKNVLGARNANAKRSEKSRKEIYDGEDETPLISSLSENKEAGCDTNCLHLEIKNQIVNSMKGKLISTPELHPENQDKNTLDVIDNLDGKSDGEQSFEYQNCDDYTLVKTPDLLETTKISPEVSADICWTNESETLEETTPSTIPSKKHIRRVKREVPPSHTNPISQPKAPVIKFQCELCPRRFIKTENLIAHMRTHQGLKPHQCSQCERAFTKLTRLKMHICEVHEAKVKEITCSYEGCGKQFRRSDSLRTHYRLKHSDEPPPEPKIYMCEDCGHTFKNATTLKEHRFRHLPSEEYPYKCEECGKRFISLRVFKEHKMRHAGIKNFMCPYCGMRKTTRNELRTHINYHTKEKQYPCPHCPNVFNSSANLGLHDRIVHKGIRRYACRFCDQSFGKADTLKHHEMRHTGEKPHECQQCGKRFIQMVALRAHQKTHRVANSSKCGDMEVVKLQEHLEKHLLTQAEGFSRKEEVANACHALAKMLKVD